MTPGEAVLDVRDLRKAFGPVMAVDGVTFQVGPGEVYALLGPNGAGKSTILHVIVGLIRPDAGEVWVLGRPMAQADASVRSAIAYIPDQTQLYGDLHAFHHLEFFGSLGRPDRPDRAWMEQVLRMVRLPEAAWTRRVKTYSHGMRQKLAIACALIRKPRLLIMDEPTLGLDPLTLQDMMTVLRDFRDSTGGTALLATHDLLFVQETADRVGVIRDGRRVAEWDRTVLRGLDLRRAYRDLIPGDSDGR